VYRRDDPFLNDEENHLIFKFPSGCLISAFNSFGHIFSASALPVKEGRQCIQKLSLRVAIASISVPPVQSPLTIQSAFDIRIYS
jgi:predicted acylesterase/phospholipase RssA